jgi:dipeptidyl aminopeptidase/acylaminoacyl peptidase
MEEIYFKSSLDGSLEPALWYHPGSTAPVPLVVGLHTWSYDRFNQVEGMLPFCRERGWALLLPEFRGPNLDNNPRALQAAGSRIAVQDVLDAVAAVQERIVIAPDSQLLLGGSGGGHMALQVAANSPELWRGVSSWVPITDLAAWYDQNPDYAQHVAACCGGAPDASPLVAQEYRERSPLYRVAELSRVNLALHHGRFDPVVPYSHSWQLALALEQQGSQRLFCEIFDGAHDIHYDVAFRWFDKLLNQGREESTRLSG